MKLVLVISCSQKNPTYVSLCHKDLKQSLLVKVNSKNTYICRQLKYHQHRIRSKTGISLEIILNVFKCLIVSLGSTKTLTLATAPLLFLLVGVLSVCEFAMVPGVYILLSPQEEEVHSSSWGHRCTHSAAHSSKRFKPLSDMIWLWQGYWWIWKNTNKEFSCVMVFIMRPSSTFQFVFGFNEGLCAIFSLDY